MAEDLQAIRAQEAGLIFSRFDEHDAFALGTALRSRAAAEELPIAIEIGFWDRRLFYAALPGSSAVNPDWLRRKAGTVRHWSRSSYRVLLERNGESVLGPNWGLDPSGYALSGGAFPIHARGFGVIGAIAVSGLHERVDHTLVVEAICDHLGVSRADFALPKE